MNFITRQNLIRFIAVLVGIFVLIVLYNFVTSGKIVVATGRADDTVIILNDKGKKVATKKGDLSIRLHHGRYTARVLRNDAEAQQYVYAHPLKTSHYNINPSDTEKLQPVANAGASDMSIGPDLLYLNPADESVYKIDSQNTTTLLDDDLLLKSVQWINPTQGVGQDYSGKLFAVYGEPSEIIPITLPGIPYFNYYSVSPDGKIYMSYNQNIYVGTINGNFKKIYTAPQPFTSLAAYTGGLAIVNSPVSKDTAPSKSTPYISLVGGPKVITKNVGLSQVAWSPNSKYLVGAAGSQFNVYDQSFNIVASLPTTSASNPTWIDNNSLVFTVGNNVWKFNVASERSDLLSSSSSSAALTTLTDVAVSSDDQYVYVVGTNLNNTSSIMRLGLKNQAPAPQIVYQLNDILPASGTNYSMSLVNFTSPPSIVVEPDNAADNASAMQGAEQQVQTFGLDTSGVRFQLVEPTAHH